MAEVQDSPYIYGQAKAPTPNSNNNPTNSQGISANVGGNRPHKPKSEGTVQGVKQVQSQYPTF